MKERCENCRFWRPDITAHMEEDEVTLTGLCQRFPPSLSRDEGLDYGFEDGVLGKEAFFPVTTHNAWCGEHQPIKEKKS